MEHDHVHGGVDGPCNCKGTMSKSRYCKKIWPNKTRPEAWSTCSKNDFIKQYESQKNNWCMEPITTNFCGKSKKKICLIISELKSEI